MSGLPRSSHALVTGGGRGIGRAIAAALVQAGATVTVLGRDRAALDHAVAAGAAHFAGVADVADQAAVNAAIAEAAARAPIDILIANAGAAEFGAVRKIRCGAVSAHDGCQLHGRGLCRPGRAARDEGAALRARGRGSIDRRPQGLRLCQRL